MAKVHKIRGRIKSVKKVGLITKAMERVAASKMRKATEAALRSRAYSSSAHDVLARLYALTSAKSHHLFAHRPIQRQLLILFSSDRGLAGAYNSNLFRLFLAQLTIPTDVIVIGQKGATFAAALKEGITLKGIYTNWPTQPSMTDIGPVIKTAVDSFVAGEVDAVKLVYTDFQSALVQKATVRELLPVAAPEVASEPSEDIFEPSADAVLTYMVPRLLEVQIYQACLEAAASEHSMRMMAMKNASDNAADITDELTLLYNRARQAGITQELAEITVGAMATT
jgi:F-type H+-transporting ATPase subunit gamma